MAANEKPPIPQNPRMRANNAKVVIIGGGVSGALTAVRLAEAGFRVTVLEKKRIGNGASSRSAACARAQWTTKETVVGMMYAEYFYAHFHELLSTPPRQRQTVFQQNGYLFLYEDPAAVAPPLRGEFLHRWEVAQQSARMQQSVGLSVEILAPQEIHKRWPHIEPGRLVGATWCNTDGFLQPDTVYLQGFRRAQELGVKVIENQEVTGAKLMGARIVAVETPDGLFKADWVVNATNAWSPRVSRRLGGMELSIAPMKRYLYFFKPVFPSELFTEEQFLRLPMTIFGMGPGRGAYARPDNLQLMMGWDAKPEDPEYDFEDEDQDKIKHGFHHKHGIANYGYEILEQVIDFAPGLVETGGLVATTCGYYDVSPDNNPLIGTDKNIKNLVHSVGFSGHGLMHAPITAVIVEAIVAGNTERGRLVQLPEPFQKSTIDLATFFPDLDKRKSKQELARL